jgi:hypothetical protein
MPIRISETKGNVSVEEEAGRNATVAARLDSNSSCKQARGMTCPIHWLRLQVNQMSTSYGSRVVTVMFSCFPMLTLRLSLNLLPFVDSRHDTYIVLFVHRVSNRTPPESEQPLNPAANSDSKVTIDCLIDSRSIIRLTDSSYVRLKLQK